MRRLEALSNGQTGVNRAEGEIKDAFKFVSVLDPLHSAYRNLCRNTPLAPSVQRDGKLKIDYSFDKAKPEDVFKAALEMKKLCAMKWGGGVSPDDIKKFTRRFWSMSSRESESSFGLFVTFDPTGYDPRCTNTFKQGSRGEAKSAIALVDALCFGLGVLQPKNEPQSGYAATIHSMNGGNPKKLHADIIGSEMQETSHLIGVTNINPDVRTDSNHDTLDPEPWDSTNLLYGNVVGGLEQIIARQDETPFIDQVLQFFQQGDPNFPNTGDRKWGGCQVIESFMDVYRLHFEQKAIWRKAPADVGELLERAKFILDNTLLETREDYAA